MFVIENPNAAFVERTGNTLDVLSVFPSERETNVVLERPSSAFPPFDLRDLFLFLCSATTRILSQNEGNNQ